MSDENRDAAEPGAGHEASELAITDDDLSGISDPALAGRLENIHQSMSTLGMRIDALVTSTTSYRSALTDRLNEYAELVTTLTRNQADELEEQRRANERALSELRRSLTASEESIERVGARIDSMVDDAESTDDASRRALAEVRSILDAQESLGRFLTESLDKFADDVLGRMNASEQAAAERVETLRAGLGTDDTSDDGVQAEVARLLDEVRETLQDLASGEVVGALWDEFRSLRTGVDSVADQLADQLGGLADDASVAAVSSEIRELRATLDGLVARVDETVAAEPGPDARLPEEVAQLNEAVRALLEQAEVVDEAAVAEAADPLLEALATDVAALRTELAAGLVVEAADDMGATLENLQSELAALGPRIDAVQARLEQPLVLDDGPEAATGDALAELADQVASLRDYTSAEFSALREATPARSTDSGSLAPPPDEDRYATIDPDVIDLLREEIRAAGEPAEGLIEALNTELKALRRRIRLRAEGEIFSDEQLRVIADAVAERLAAET